MALSERMRAAIAAALKDEPNPAIRRLARLMMRPDPPERTAKRTPKPKRKK